MKSKFTLRVMIALSALATLANRNRPGVVVLGNDGPPPGGDTQSAAPSAAEQELARRDKREQDIKARVAVGLTREQAEAAVDHQDKFTERYTKVQAEQKAARKK